jgi:hypothetical protein
MKTETAFEKFVLTIFNVYRRDKEAFGREFSPLQATESSTRCGQ